MIERAKLKQGEWYTGTSTVGQIALWDGDHFLSYTWQDGCKPVSLEYGTGFAPDRMVL